MIKDVKIAKELAVTVANKTGVLADMSSLLTEAGINIEAVAGYAINNEAKIMLVTEDNTRTSDILKKANYKNIKENNVIVVELENKPGALQLVTSKLAAETIDIKQIYGSVCASSCPTKLVITTDDNQKALIALKK